MAIHFNRNFASSGSIVSELSAQSSESGTQVSLWSLSSRIGQAQALKALDAFVVVDGEPGLRSLLKCIDFDEPVYENPLAKFEHNFWQEPEYKALHFYCIDKDFGDIINRFAVDFGLFVRIDNTVHSNSYRVSGPSLLVEQLRGYISMAYDTDRKIENKESFFVYVYEENGDNPESFDIVMDGHKKRLICAQII